MAFRTVRSSSSRTRRLGDWPPQVRSPRIVPQGLCQSFSIPASDPCKRPTERHDGGSTILYPPNPSGLHAAARHHGPLMMRPNHRTYILRCPTRHLSCSSTTMWVPRWLNVVLGLIALNMAAGMLTGDDVPHPPQTLDFCQVALGMLCHFMPCSVCYVSLGSI